MKKSKIKELIKKELQEGEDLNKIIEEEESLEDIKTQRVETETQLIDELIASIPKNQGYYVKLYKVLPTNELEYKMRIDDWQRWSDVEYEVGEIVKNQTARNPSKWGSGKYRIVFWKDGGIRGHRFRPIDFYIDAGEVEQKAVSSQPVIDISEPVKNSVSALSELVETIKTLMPNIKPEELQNHLVQSFHKGLETANLLKEGNSNTNTAILQSLFNLVNQLILKEKEKKEEPKDTFSMKEIIEMIVNIQNQNQKKEKSITEIIAELKAVGLIKDEKNEKLTSKISELKDIIMLIKELTPYSENVSSPSTFEKILEHLAPYLPDLVGKITFTINNVIDFAKLKILQSTPEGIKYYRPSLGKIEEEKTLLQESSILKTEQKTEEKQKEPLTKETEASMLESLKSLIMMDKDFKYFPAFFNELVKDEKGIDLLNAVVFGNEPVENIIASLNTNEKSPFKDEAVFQKTKEYFEKFKEYITEKRINDLPFLSLCSVCGTEYEFENVDQFLSAVYLCDNESCKGKLIAKYQKSE